MKETAGSDASQDRPGDDDARREAPEHGHTGQGAASALAHLILQGEKHRRQNPEAGEGVTSHG